MSVYFASLCVRLCGRGGADHRTGPLGRGGDVRDPARVEPHQRAPQAAAHRLHRQRRSSPGLNIHTLSTRQKQTFASRVPLAHTSTTIAASGNVSQNGRIFASELAAAHSRRPSPCAYLFVRSRWGRWSAGPLALVAFVPVRLASHGRPSETVFCRLCNSGGRLCICRLCLYERLFSSSAQFDSLPSSFTVDFFTASEVKT